MGSRGHAHAITGNRTEASRLAQELPDKSRRETIDNTTPVLIYVGLGEIEKKLEWTEKSDY